MGVYLLRSEKINGFVSYISPLPENKYMIRSESGSWIFEEVRVQYTRGTVIISFFIICDKLFVSGVVGLQYV